MAAAGSAGLFQDLGRRAVARAAATQAGATGFAAELIAETVSYYVSRDLPSYVGAPGRVQTAAEVLALKERIRDVARATVRASGEATPEPRAWRQYVGRVLTALQRSPGA